MDSSKGYDSLRTDETMTAVSWNIDTMTSLSTGASSQGSRVSSVRSCKRGKKGVPRRPKSWHPCEPVISEEPEPYSPPPPRSALDQELQEAKRRFSESQAGANRNGDSGFARGSGSAGFAMERLCQKELTPAVTGKLQSMPRSGSRSDLGFTPSVKFTL